MAESVAHGVAASVPPPLPSGAAATKKGGAASRAALRGLEALAPRKAGAALRVAVLGLALVSGMPGFNAHATVPTQTATHVRMEQLAPRVTAPSAAVLAAVGQVASLTQQDVLRAVERAQVSAVVAQSRTLQVGSGKMVVPAGTSLSASIDESGVVIRAHPAVVVTPRLGPDVLVDSLRYSFDEASFHVDARGFGPDFLYAKIATFVANQALQPRLPDLLRQPGFNPRDAGHLETLQAALDGLTAGPQTGPGGIGMGAAMSSLNNVSAAVTVSLPRPIQRDLTKDISLELPARTRLELTVTTSGAAGDLTPERAVLRAMGGELPLVQKGDGALSSLTVESLTLTRNPHATSAQNALSVSAEYRLSAEKAVDGVVMGLGALVALAHGESWQAGAQAAADSAGEVRLTGVRQKIDDAIANVGPRLAEILVEAAPAFPGLHLDRLLPPGD